MATLNKYTATEFATPSDVNFEIASRAKDAGWEVICVPAVSEIYTFFSAWSPGVFVPITAFGISKTGGVSGELLTPPDFPEYTPPAGYARKDMDSPIAAVQYIAQFFSGVLGYSTYASQVTALGVYGILCSWEPTHSEDFYKVTRPTKAEFDALIFIGASLGLGVTQPKFGGYILKAPIENGQTLNIWLDNAEDPSGLFLATISQFFATQTNLQPSPHPRSIEGYPPGASSVLTFMGQLQAFTYYVNSKNLWVMAESGTFFPHWYIMNLYPRGDVSSAMLVMGETVPVGPRYMTDAPIWWMNFNDEIFIRPAANLSAQVGRLISIAGLTSPLQWEDGITECTEFLLFAVQFIGTGSSFRFLGLSEDVLIGHKTYSEGETISFDAANFYTLTNTNGAGVLVRV